MSLLIALAVMAIITIPIVGAWILALATIDWKRR